MNVLLIVLLLCLAATLYAKLYRAARLSLKRRPALECATVLGLRLSAYLSVAITALIFFSVVFETGMFFGKVNVVDFLFGTQWSPQVAIRADQAGATGLFGFLPLFAGTLLITVIALSIAVPIGLFAAIYMSEYASVRIRQTAKPMLEMLAGIPTVVYGFFAVIVVAPFLRQIGAALGMDVASESALAAGLVMSLVLIPLISSLSDDAMKAVPQSLRDASLAMGATQSETVTRVVLPAALSGIMGGILLATSRAIGETMIVVMAAGLAANMTLNPLESVTTITVQIVALLVGDQEFGSTKTLAAFALGLTLFLFTLLLNVVALLLVRRYRQMYD
jgi:phosphate transport system permease protein